FNNSANEAFTVTFNVIGNLARPSGGSSSSSSSSGGGGSGGTSSASSSTGTITNMVFTVTYNPLLNTLKWQLTKQ
ncbi:MAG TPA: hypothetical protein DC054_20405, partial [Blastocatellia bacterium]|nr:hypothetical protein [Blastocatellia bacterium]